VRHGGEPVQPEPDRVDVAGGDGLDHVERRSNVLRKVAPVQRCDGGQGVALHPIAVRPPFLRTVVEAVVEPFVADLGTQDRFELQELLPVPVDEVAGCLLRG